MSMIKCAECGQQISDRAVSCPGCGAPIARGGAAPTTVIRAGAKWEKLGFVLIVAGMLIGATASPALGGTLGITGFVVFVVGRLN